MRLDADFAAQRSSEGVDFKPRLDCCHKVLQCKKECCVNRKEKTLSVSVNLCQEIVKGFFWGDGMSIPLSFCARKLLLAEHRGRRYALLLN